MTGSLRSEIPRRCAPRDDGKEVVILSEAKDLLRHGPESRSFVAALLRMTGRICPPCLRSEIPRRCAPQDDGKEVVILSEAKDLLRHGPESRSFVAALLGMTGKICPP